MELNWVCEVSNILSHHKLNLILLQICSTRGYVSIVETSVVLNYKQNFMEFLAACGLIPFLKMFVNWIVVIF